ncbi:hypothetical protein B8Z50_001477 [Escherichia coli]|nr:hypothetical protein [Escherichia coli]
MSHQSAHQQEMSLFPVKEVEVNGVQMGVLNDGTPFLSLRGLSREGANKRGNSSRLTQSFHFFMFESIFSPVNALNQPI